MFEQKTLKNKFLAQRRQGRKEITFTYFPNLRAFFRAFKSAETLFCAITFSGQLNFKGKSLMRLARRTIKRARIEIIPMIDTIFFLLVFFMISTLSMSRYSGLPVNLPKAATGQQPASESAAVTITPEGKVYIDKQEVPRESIRTVLQQRLSANAELLVLINADERVEHGLVVDVMDAARQAGVAKMAIAVKPKDSRQ